MVIVLDLYTLGDHLITQNVQASNTLRHLITQNVQASNTLRQWYIDNFDMMH